MSQRHSISGRRSGLVWLAILLLFALVTLIAVVALLIVPEQAEKRALARATVETEARLAAEAATAQAETAEVERQYQAGVAFQAAGRWDDAIAAFTEGVRRAPGYKDASARMAQVSQTRVAAGASADATATAKMQVEQGGRATATAEALEAHYQKGLGHINLKQWAQAKGQLEQVFEVDPNYKDVQAQLAVVADALNRQAPTSTPIPANTPAPAIVIATNIAPQGKVEVSSIYPYQPADCYNGSKAIDGVIEDISCHSWATSGEGAGAWLKITLPTVRHVNQVILYDRPNPTDYVIQGKLTFSDGTELETGDLPNGGAPRKLSFEQKNVTWIKFTVVQSTGPNIGLGEIEIYGW